MRPLARYILKRTVVSVMTVFVIVYVVFSLSRMAGDPVEAYVTPETPPEVVDIIRKKYRLDEPIPVQFVYWLEGVSRGDLGRAVSYGDEPLVDLLRRYLPLTVELNLYGLLLALPLIYWMGTKSAIKKDRWFDHVSRLVAIIGRCLPEFFIGLVILATLYPRGWIVVDPRWTFSKITGMPTVDALLNGDLNGFVDTVKYIIGPLLTSLVGSLALNIRVLRSSILEEMSKDYINTGRSKGLSKDYVDKKYARRNALIPFTTMLGFWVGSIFFGTAILEEVFNRRGIGSISAQAARVTDHNTLQATTMVYSVMLVFTNLIVDIAYSFLDPRIKYGEEK